MEHVDALERFHGRMTACHVVVKAPDRRHRTGGQFEIADSTSVLDERFADPLFAVGDAFRRARRRIQDRIRRQRGDVKFHRPRSSRTSARQRIRDE